MGNITLFTILEQGEKPLRYDQKRIKNLQDLATEVLSVLELDQLKIPGWLDGAELDIRLSSFQLDWRWDLD